MIKLILSTLLLAIIASGCVGTITNKNVAQDASNGRENSVAHTAKGTNNSIINNSSTEVNSSNLK